jgi:hypothetical protein
VEDFGLNDDEKLEQMERINEIRMIYGNYNNN